jgi:hypothetical protein
MRLSIQLDSRLSSQEKGTIQAFAVIVIAASGSNPQLLGEGEDSFLLPTA